MEERSFAGDLAAVRAALPRTDQTTAVPVLIVISGLPGTGKSFLAHRIAGRLPAVTVESDFVRKTLFPRPSYTGPESVWVHRIAHVAIERLLRSGRHVIYDATNLSEWHRGKTYRLAERAGAQVVVVRTVAPEKLVRERLTRRLSERDPGDISDATWEIYEHYKRDMEAITHPHLVVDTSRDMDRAVSRILRAVRLAQRRS